MYSWEQCKADYIFKSVTEKGYPELPVLSASQELGMVYRDQNGIDIQHDKKNESSYKRVSPGQFVIHLRSFQGGFAYSEVEGITSPAYTVMSFKNSSEQYGLFWKYVFKSETFIKRLETITYGIRDGRNISFSDFKSLMLQYPSFLEQELIGDLIAIIESGITLHQRKLDNLKLKKKALLQKLFPKNGERYPELRFPGFTDAWEQRKFKDIAFKRGKISEADLPYVEFEDINSGIGTLNKNISQKVGHKKGLLFEAGDVLFGKLRPYLQNWLLCQFAGIAVGDFWVLQPQNVSSAFLYYLIQSEAYQSVANISSGTKMPRSSWPLVSETLFSIPKYKEANMIGEFFLLIDRTITLHQ